MGSVTGDLPPVTMSLSNAFLLAQQNSLWIVQMVN